MRAGYRTAIAGIRPGSPGIGGTTSMSRQLVKSACVLAGTALLWRVAAELEHERRQLPVVRREEVTVESAPDMPPARVRRVRINRQVVRGVDAVVVAVPVVLGLIGMVITVWALTHPLHVSGIVAAVAGLAAIVVSLLIVIRFPRHATTPGEHSSGDEVPAM